MDCGNLNSNNAGMNTLLSVKSLEHLDYSKNGGMLIVFT